MDLGVIKVASKRQLPKPSTYSVNTVAMVGNIPYTVTLNKAGRRYWSKGRKQQYETAKVTQPVILPQYTHFIPIKPTIQSYQKKTQIFSVTVPLTPIATHTQKFRLPDALRSPIITIKNPGKQVFEVPTIPQTRQIVKPKLRVMKKTETMKKTEIFPETPVCTLLTTPPWIPKTATLKQTLRAILDFQCEMKEMLSSMYTTAQHYIYDILNSLLKENDYKVAGAIYIRFIQRAIVSSIETINFGSFKSDFRFTSYYVDLSQGKGETQWKHATMLVVDNKKKTAEYFDPYGKSNFNRLQSTDVALKEWTKENLPGYTYVATAKICPAIGPQALTGDAYCASWTALYTYLRIKHSDMQPIEIITQLIDLSHRDLVKIVEAFVCFQYQYLIQSGVKTIIDEYDSQTKVVPLELLSSLRMRGDYQMMCSILFPAY